MASTPPRVPPELNEQTQLLFNCVHAPDSHDRLRDIRVVPLAIRPSNSRHLFSAI
jgi:hypothetical protein